MVTDINEERLRRYPSPGIVQSALFVVRQLRERVEALEALLLEHLEDLQPTKETD